MEDRKGKTIVVSGGFDPIHPGHVRMFKAAKDIVGDTGKLVVILNGDSWLIRKKGKRFMSQGDRKEIIESIECVDEAFIYESDECSVNGALEKVRPDIFANGGDRRNEEDIPESSICAEFGIEIIFNIGGDKYQSSSELLKMYNGR